MTGYGYDRNIDDVYTTNNKKYAENWVNRFNNIISENIGRIEDYIYVNDDIPFWADYILEYKPYAMFSDVEYRNK